MRGTAPRAAPAAAPSWPGARRGGPAAGTGTAAVPTWSLVTVLDQDNLDHLQY